MIHEVSARGADAFDDLAPGQEGDHRIATLVMRWRLFHYPGNRTGPRAWEEWLDMRNNAQSGGPDGGFHPTLDWTQAIQAARAWLARNTNYEFHVALFEDEWIARFHRPGFEFSAKAPADLGPLAISRAVLKAATAGRR